MDPKNISNQFEFARDSFAFANELVWEYRTDVATGKRIFHRQNSKPIFSHRCFALACVTRQFFYHARFEADQPVDNCQLYQGLVRAVMGRHPRVPCNPDEKIVIPGFSGLRDFSRSHENLLKRECGGAWRSYFLRSHWRMAFPFSRRHQARTAEALIAALGNHRLPMLHLVDFPTVSINHCIIVFDVVKTSRGWEFKTCDPNNSQEPEQLLFDGWTRTFTLPANACWAGGALNVSHINRSWFF